MTASSDMAWALDLLVNVLVKGTGILVAALVLTRLMRGCSAAARHAVWSLALGGLLLVPLLDAVLPSWRVEGVYLGLEETAVPAHTDIARALSTEAGDRWRADDSAPLTGDPLTVQVPVISPPANPMKQGLAVPLGGLLIALWGGGVLVLLARLALDVRHASLIDRRARTCRNKIRMLAVPLAHGVGVSGKFRIVVSDEVSAPLSWGWLFPAIVLPAGAERWTSDRMRSVLLHELYHVKRCDHAIHVMTELACALYWFNPLVWIAARAAATECERACDDQALQAGVRSDVYAGHLVEIARLQLGDIVPRGAFAMAHRSSLATRISSILNERLERKPMSRLALLTAGVVGIALVLPTASIDLWGFVEPGREMLRGIVHGQDAVSRRVAELDDRDPRVRRYAAWALGELESDRGVLPLIDKLEDRNADVRLISAWALGEIKSGVAIDPLIALLGDADPLVREMAVLSLGEIEDESAVAPLLDGLERDHGLLEPVIWALGEIGGPGRPVRTALIREAGRRHWDNDQVWTGNVGTREVRHMANDLARLLVALQDDDATTRCSAAEWLGRLGDDQAVEPLLDTLRDREATVRAMAVWALDEINPSRHSSP